ncbi:O-antigen ligase family protein [Fulvivirga kasyanovii]|uniref:O-antigen ligase family protein n=1 Tax=Fulvivirga kasyanovii TaxID=396812 RepID=UPI0031E09AB2
MIQQIGQQYKSLRKVAHTLLVLNVLNIGNYTFLAYSVSGTAVSSPLFDLLAYLRLPLSFISLVWIYAVSPESFRGYIYFLKRNLDVSLFCILIFVGALVSQTPLNSFLYAFWTVSTIYSILLYIHLLSVNWAIKSYIKVFSFFIMVINGVMLFFVVPSLSNIYKIGPEAVYFTSKSIYALPVSAISVAIIAYLLDKQKIKMKIFVILFLVLLVCFIALLGSGKRTAFISVSLCLVIYLFYKAKKIAFLAVLLVPFYWKTYVNYLEKTTAKYGDESYTISRLNRIDTGGQALVDDSSYEARLLLWKYFLGIYYDNAIFGIGLNNREAAEQRYKKKSFLGELSYHNSYLHLLVELGLPAFLLFMFILIRSFLLILRKGTTRVKVQYFVLLLPALSISWVETNTLPGQILFLYVFLVWLFPRIYLVQKFSIKKSNLTNYKEAGSLRL